MTEAVRAERGQIHDVDPEYSQAAPPSGYIRLDLACGGTKKEGWVGVDIVTLPTVDVVHDLSATPWPFADDTVLEINCSHFVEHVTDLKRFMEECWRILVPGGLMTVTAPYWTSVRAWQDYTHVRAITERTFSYFSRPEMIRNGLGHYDARCDFDITAMRFVYLPEWEPRAPDAREWAREHYVNVVADIIVQLSAVKPMRQGA